MTPDILKPLTPLQARFVREYLVDLSATGAARRVGIGGKAPWSAASRLLKKPHVKAAVDLAVAAAIAERQTPVMASRQLLINELARAAFTHQRELVDWGWEKDEPFARVKASAELTHAQSAAVAEVSLSGGTLKLKTLDRMAAMLALARLLGAGEEREAQERQDAGPDVAAMRAAFEAVPREVRDQMRALLSQTPAASREEEDEA